MYYKPTQGIYKIGHNVTISEPTGKMIEIKNPHRKWWCPWRPKFIKVPEIKNRYVPSEDMKFHFENGAIVLKFDPERKCNE